MLPKERFHDDGGNYDTDEIYASLLPLLPWPKN
jgi:hypothetical protein